MHPAYYLGFEPGGVGTFGWAVAARSADEQPRVTSSGCALNAQAAVAATLRALPAGIQPAAVGIDAPLFWTATGIRHVDTVVRREMHARGALSPGGTVQQLNSLRGACLVQGVVAAMLLRRGMPKVRITETHPKALLWHLGLASPERPPRQISVGDLSELLVATSDAISEHERDAVISCAAAVAFHEQREGWHDLTASEPDPMHLVPGGVAYWMPVGSGDATA
jgi:predicted nuclease with RNAse H fold